MNFDKVKELTDELKTEMKELKDKKPIFGEWDSDGSLSNDFLVWKRKYQTQAMSSSVLSLDDQGEKFTFRKAGIYRIEVVLLKNVNVMTSLLPYLEKNDSVVALSYSSSSDKEYDNNILLHTMEIEEGDTIGIKFQAKKPNFLYNNHNRIYITRID
eukprot:CAMPEP_0170517076 /NCGR_PEP_ID=MMETSP0209-20121228/3166_1 /TAXON_ID=665100 ORGANISM="Litonotus pictus, Strain P1" /NCGR_SAMPLE_ID=MMETSP0209 /ASSEMBLY_ACC=CAM_ASM_000301 /LENGTH=155 /DNA_ID=CAMNT_0010802229 /DNA_START=184 /DNA_END=651 /DNA_ORIENTATION=+